MKRRMHKNSLKAYASLKLGPMGQAVLRTYMMYGPTTDRQTNNMFMPCNKNVQPRITYLVNKRLLRETGSVRCVISGRLARVCKITALGRKALRK